MLQLHRNYTSEWMLHFYYSDMFSDEYLELQQVQGDTNERFPNNSEPLQMFLDVSTHILSKLIYFKNKL